jgi:Rrf2 family protein
MLSTTAEYALRIMVVLAESKGAPTTSERIAARARVPTDYSVKVLQALAREQLVLAQRGRGGGFRINCDPQRTSLLAIINAIEPLPRVKECPIGGAPARGTLCRLHRCIDDVLAQAQESLERTTLASVLDPGGADGLCEPPPLEVKVVAGRKREAKRVTRREP